MISAKTSRDTGYLPQKCVSRTENPPLLAKSATTQGILHKRVYREHAPHHYTQNDAATQDIRHKSVYREQKNRHYRQNSAATQIFRLKSVCREGCTVISDRKSVSRTGWVQKSVSHGNSVPRAIQVGFRRASRDRLVSKNHRAVSRRKIKGAGKEVGKVGGHEDVHGYVSVAGGRNGR